MTLRDDVEPRAGDVAGSDLIEEEQNLLARVSRSLREAPERPTASEAPIVRELQRIPEVIVSGTDWSLATTVFRARLSPYVVLSSCLRCGAVT